MPLGFTRVNEQRQRPNPNINFIKPLEGPHKDVSLDFLSRVAAISAPIMRTNYISVMSLEEFEPNREFWGRNFNAGEVIQLVLKSPSTGRWLPFRFVQMVFMHELAHCKQMNHGRAFWQVRNAYSTELKALWDKSYTGDGLWGRGQSLYDGQFAHNTLPAADGELVRNLCGGTYRGVGSRKKRKLKSEKSQLTYAERKQRRIAKKFGTNGLALGDDDDVRAKLENGKKAKGKPRVAGSIRGRELRAAALLERLEQAKATPIKTEDNDTDTDDESDYEEVEGRQEAVDAHGQRILDSKGYRLVRVCEGEDDEHDGDAQRELDELGQISTGQSSNTEFSNSLIPETREEESATGTQPFEEAHTHTRLRKPSCSKTEASRNITKDTDLQKLSQLSSNSTGDTVTIQTKSNPSTEMSNSCPICSLSNSDEALTCAACAHVLQPDKLTDYWHCTSSECSTSKYINPGDGGVCGICGAAKSASSY